MRCDETIRRGKERAAFNGRFDSENVQASTGNALVVQCFGEINFNNQWTAARVQEKSGFLH